MLPRFPEVRMKDGLYKVVTEYFVAGFAVKNGKIISCVPV